ncbi:MAG: hydrogenase maturation nickel metallochaperone HypA [Candidatus Neomarinimicrobiota bacterium]|nr:MAG: hydrogenase maturation nickel metallochaperone HypA [Candidatus Neomarinimicrobiota bacterium]
MHEMSIALSICDLAAAEAHKAGGGRIKEVEVEIGTLAGVMVEALEFCFETAKRSTPLAEANLKIVTVPAAGHCHTCGARFAADHYLVTCPECHSFQVVIEQGKELRVKTISIE